ncbi:MULTISPECIES: SPFH domain-containing protein [Streptomyces]|uniref:SPFH domain-containing protein n=1 Tax=Streptomyces TaxID=1883 RepID=UPI001EFF0742|nr:MULTISPECIES: SPFH domain-containing protein [Streptomyces]
MPAPHAEPQPTTARPDFQPATTRTEPRPATARTERQPRVTPAARTAPQPHAARAEQEPAIAPARTGPQGHVTRAEPQGPDAATAGSAGDGHAPHPAPQPPAEPTPPVPEAPTAPQHPAGIPHPQGAGVPGPGVAEVVAQAVARGIEGGREGARGETAAGPLARRAPVRGAAVIEVPVHLPFRGQPMTPETTTTTGPGTTAGAANGTTTGLGTATKTGATTTTTTMAGAKTTAALTPRPAERAAAAGRRVPLGDERLREHRGPVLPGWIAVVVGALALTGCAAVLWRAGVVPAALVAAFGVPPRPYHGLRATHWPPLAFLGVVTLLALGGLGRARAGHAWVLTLFGSYRGTVRRTGLTWISPLLLRRRVDVRLRHWRSEPMPAVDSGGLALQVVVQVVWQVRDTARATLAVEDHIDYLAEQVESATARVLSRLPADAFHDDAPTLRDAEAVGEALTRTLAAETEAIGIEVFSAQPTRIEYAPEVAEAMRRRRIAAIDAKHRDTVLTAVVDAVDDTVHRLTSRGIVELDDYERKALVKDLTVAFYTGRSDQ